MPWDFCDFCLDGMFEVAKFTITHNDQELTAKLCVRDARYLNESGTDKDFETLRRRLE